MSMKKKFIEAFHSETDSMHYMTANSAYSERHIFGTAKPRLSGIIGGATVAEW